MAGRLSNLPRLLKQVYRFRRRSQAAQDLGIPMLWRRRRRASLTRKLAREWPGAFVRCDSGDLAFVPAPVDFQGLRILFYGFEVLPAVLNFVPENGVAIDVGANLGEWSVPLAKAVGSGGRVLCYEPNPLVAEALRKTLRINNLPQAYVSTVALSDQEGCAQLIVEAEHTGRARLAGVESAPGSLTVSTRRLDDAVAELNLARVDFIKIDVEGHERRVVEGAVETLRRFSPAVVIESGHEGADDRLALAATFERLGYDLVCILHHHGAAPCGWADYRSAQGACGGRDPLDLLLLPRSRDPQLGPT